MVTTPRPFSKYYEVIGIGSRLQLGGLGDPEFNQDIRRHRESAMLLKSARMLLMRSPRTATFLCVTFLAIGISGYAQQFAGYCNDRFGFCIRYPVTLERKSAPMNGDGQGFRDQIGFTMSVFGRNDDGAFDQKMATETKDFDDVTYRAVGKSWFVLSGHKGRKVLYRKLFVGSQSTNALYIEYPIAIKNPYDMVVQKVANSFKPGKLDERH